MVALGVPHGHARKPVVISTMAMRFYSKYGWTADILARYLVRGSLREFDKGSEEFHYFVLETHSELDVERMVLDGHIGELLDKDRWGELKGMSDLQILQDRNW